MRNSLFAGIKAARPLVAASALPPVLWRMHQSDSTVRNVGATFPVARGYPTVVTMGSTPTVMAGSWVTLASLAGITALNGTWRVLWVRGNDVALDVDSSAMPAWTSGGTMSPAVWQDEFSQVAALPVQGTTTGLWANPSLGVTAHTAGSNSLRQSTGISQFDLTSHAGIVVIGANVWRSAAPSATETIFGLGILANTGSGSAVGTFTMQMETDGQVSLVARPQTAADGGGSNGFTYSGAIATTTQTKVSFIIDMTNPAAWQVSAVVNGILSRSGTPNMTNAIGGPGNAAGIAVGARINAGLGLGGLMGANGSGMRVENVMFWKTNSSITTVLRAIQRWHSTGLLTPLMA